MSCFDNKKMIKNESLNTIRVGLVTKKHKEVLLPFLKEIGISEAMFTDPDYDCDLKKLVQLFEIAALNLQRPNLGLEFGKETLSSDMGLFGQALRSQNTIKEMLDWLEKYIVIHQQATAVTYQIIENKVFINYEIQDPSIIEKRQDAEFSIATAHSLLTELVSLPPKLLRVNFAHSAPKDTSEHSNFFQCPIYFNQTNNTLIYKNELLSRHIETRNHALLTALEAYIEELHQLKSQSSNFITKLDIAISKQLSDGGTNLTQIANQMAMSPRTLQRRLANLNIHFGDHVETLRKTIASHYVKESSISLTEIALLLGYSEASSFSRAFKRWTGYTPGQYRKKVFIKNELIKK